MKDVLRYFLRNPQAADNLEGGARWRLLNETIHRSLEETSRALDWLLAQGLLVEVATPGSGRAFRLNQEKRADAESFLTQSESSRAEPGED